jgi:hypothetical protein
LGNDGTCGEFNSNEKKNIKAFEEGSSFPPKPSQKIAVKVEKKDTTPKGRKVSLVKEKGKQLAQEEEIPPLPASSSEDNLFVPFSR